MADWRDGLVQRYGLLGLLLVVGIGSLLTGLLVKDGDGGVELALGVIALGGFAVLVVLSWRGQTGVLPFSELRRQLWRVVIQEDASMAGAPPIAVNFYRKEKFVARVRPAEEPPAIVVVSPALNFREVQMATPDDAGGLIAIQAFVQDGGQVVPWTVPPDFLRQPWISFAVREDPE